MKKRNPVLFVFLLLLSAVLFVSGLYFILKPTLNQKAQEAQAASAVASFFELRDAPENAGSESLVPQLVPLDGEPADRDADAAPRYPELLTAMQAYNEQIYNSKQTGLADPWCYTATVIDLAAWGYDGEMVGILTIPKMELEEPIYLGATADHLSRGAAQLSFSSMPIGGVNTNCVLAGHRGWDGALHFRHIELLEVGDEIQLTNLWETLTYEVVEIRIIQPWQPEELLIQEGRDLLTLLTCHPYGSGGKYRYVVYCERKEN